MMNARSGRRVLGALFSLGLASGVGLTAASSAVAAGGHPGSENSLYSFPRGSTNPGRSDGGGGGAAVASGQAEVEVTRQGSEQRNAIGNSALGLVQHGEMCLSAPGKRTDGMPARLSDCTAAVDRGWAYAADRTLRLAYSGCLTQDGDAIHVRDCKGSRELGTFGKVSDDAKRWTYDKSSKTLKNAQSGRCLAAAADGRLTTATCGGSSAQKWTIPSTCGAGTPSKTPESAPTRDLRPAGKPKGNSPHSLGAQPPAAGRSGIPTEGNSKNGPSKNGPSKNGVPEDNAPKKDTALAETGAGNALLPLGIAATGLLVAGALVAWVATSRWSRSGEGRVSRRGHV
ncbi:hypothetical protein FCH28_13520 [Streptomyces piniterrae]|uniref:Ricin B lectin domain-containing protein n=1 Tax=Streptomyces piniterrae TaxID=2571125 RepID=A0A4V5MKQ5_9ACTN|nr:RICIN domain-containing protein [Streptomyces piniterrae]TJZ54198.1 hypothetical protein FCH28_13520 [Streptomyces piniterrae]